jgi:hypothetical protein
VDRVGSPQRDGKKMTDPNDKKGQRLVFKLQGERLFEILVKRISGGIIMKPLIGDVNTHQHIYQTNRGIEHHITQEGPRNRDPQRHTQRGVVDIERLIRMQLAGFCPDGVTPPRIANLKDEEELRKLASWLDDMSRKIVHLPTHRQLKRPIGELAKFWNLVFSMDEKKDVAIDPFRDFKLEDWEGDRIWKPIMEDEMHFPDKSLAFTEDETHMITLDQDGFIVEWNLRLAMEYQASFFKEIGTDDYLESSISNEAIAEELKKKRRT